MLSSGSLGAPEKRPFFGFCARRLMPAVLALAALLAVLSACSSPSTTNTGNSSTPSATSTTAPTATPKPEPTSVPQVTLAFCQHILSLAEANQIMQPAKPAYTIQVTPLSSGGLCDYLSSPSLSGLVVQIRIGGYTGTRPLPQQEVENYFKQGLNQPGVTVLSITSVSGVGDQAGLVIGSYTYQVTVYGAAFYVLYGTIVFECGNVYASSPSTAQTGALQQCAQLVVSQL